MNLESFKTKLRTFLWVSRVPQSKFVANQSMGSLVHARTNKQTDKQRLQFYLFRYDEFCLGKLPSNPYLSQALGKLNIYSLNIIYSIKIFLVVFL